MFSEITRLSESHQTLRQLARKLGECEDKQVCSVYEQLLHAAEQTFRNEQRLMEKHQFPATQSHLEQHARVLGALHRTHCAIMAGNHELARHVGGNLLLSWFELHNATLDAALAAWAAYRISPIMRDFSEGKSWRSWPRSGMRPPAPTQPPEQSAPRH